MLKAAGTVGNTSVTYYSAATAADVGNTVNVTPFTNLIVSNIAAQMAETYFSDTANIAKIGTLITPAKLAAAQTALHDKLKPVLDALGISSSIDLLRSSFAADHSGMDAILDLVKVETDTTTNVVTLKNALTNLAIATDDVRVSTDDATVVDRSKISEITTTAATDLQFVMAKLNSFSALFATALPTQATLANSGVFDTSSNFMMGGKTFSQFATELSTQQSAIGLKFSNVSITPVANDPNTMILSALIISNTDTFNEKIRLTMVKSNNVWLVQGDGRIADLSIRAQAQRNEWSNVNSSSSITNSGINLSNGLNIYIDPFAYNSNHSSAQAVAALITGPGLPDAGITMVQDVQNTWFKLSGSQNSNNLVPDCASATSTQCVTISQALDNSQYTVILKDSNGTSLNGTGYALTLPKQPYATSDLTTAMFPAFTAITVDGQPITFSALVATKTVSVTWTMPTNLKSKYANIWATNTLGASYFRTEKDLAPTATNALFGLGTPLASGTVSNAGAWLEGVDSFGRRFAASRSISLQIQ